MRHEDVLTICAVKDVIERQVNPSFDPADSRSYELRFCSRLLLPPIQ